MAKIGIYTGTFDPVHKGHIGFGLAAARVCDLEQVFLIPEEQPRGKQQVTELQRRLAMLGRATEPFEQLQVLRLGDAQFSVAKTLPQLQQWFAGNELSLLVGSDVIKTLPEWEGVNQLLEAVKLVVGLRSGDQESEVRELLARLGQDLNVEIISSVIPAVHGSLASSRIRKNVHVASDLTPEVGDYIRQHELYATS